MANFGFLTSWRLPIVDSLCRLYVVGNKRRGKRRIKFSISRSSDEADKKRNSFLIRSILVRSKAVSALFQLIKVFSCVPQLFVIA